MIKKYNFITSLAVCFSFFSSPSFGARQKNVFHSRGVSSKVGFKSVQSCLRLSLKSLKTLISVAHFFRHCNKYDYQDLHTKIPTDRDRTRKCETFKTQNLIKPFAERRVKRDIPLAA
jgi:hypothetical protein